jgi:hypothetical protein
MMVETDIVTSIAASPIGRDMIMYVETFKTDVIAFIVNVIMRLTYEILTISLCEIKVKNSSATVTCCIMLFRISN